MFKVSHSRLMTYLTCKKRFQFKYVDKYEPIQKSPALEYGSFVHSFLQYFHNTKINYTFDDSIGRAVIAVPTITVEMYEELREKLNDYVNWSRRAKKDSVDRHHTQHIEYCNTEIEFNVPILTANNKPSSRIYLNGFFDGLVYDHKFKEYYLLEHKTTKRPKQLMDGLPYDLQASIYLYAANLWFDFPVRGIIYNIIDKKSSDNPLLPSGRFSKNKQLKISYENYYHQLQSHLLQQYQADKEKVITVIRDRYKDILNHLRQNPKMFHRVFVTRTRAQLEETRKLLHNAGLEMYRKQEYTTNPHLNSCRWCAYQAICPSAIGQFQKPYFNLFTKEDKNRTG